MHYWRSRKVGMNYSEAAEIICVGAGAVALVVGVRKLYRDYRSIVAPSVHSDKEPFSSPSFLKRRVASDARMTSIRRQQADLLNPSPPK